MSSGYTLWAAKTPLSDDEIKKISPRFASPIRSASSEWVILRYRNDFDYAGELDDPEYSITRELSKSLSEVLFLIVDKGTDAFLYEHSRGGELIRKLNWFVLSTESPAWDSVMGTMEPWEEEIIFAERNLVSQLKIEANQYGPNSAAFKEREARLREIWSSRTYTVGETIPPCDWTAGEAVLKWFGITRPAK